MNGTVLKVRYDNSLIEEGGGGIGLLITKQFLLFMPPVPAAWADSQNLQLFFICGGVSRLEACTGSAFQYRSLCRSAVPQPPPASLRYHLQRTKGRRRSWTQIKGKEEQKRFDLLSVGPLQIQTKIDTKKRSHKYSSDF